MTDEFASGIGMNSTEMYKKVYNFDQIYACNTTLNLYLVDIAFFSTFLRLN
jgi:hypothetical protein